MAKIFCKMLSFMKQNITHRSIGDIRVFTARAPPLIEILLYFVTDFIELINSLTLYWFIIDITDQYLPYTQVF